MTMKSTQAQYGRVAVALHWSIAVLVLVALVSGFGAEAFGQEAHGALRAHVAAGLTVGLLTLARIAWWWLADVRPDPAPDAEGMRGSLARTVHILLIVVPVGMAASGIGMMVLSGAGAQLFGGVPGALPEFDKLLPRAPHGIGARVLVALIGLHVSAALYHHFARRDALIRRMWFSSRT